MTTNAQPDSLSAKLSNSAKHAGEWSTWLLASVAWGVLYQVRLDTHSSPWLLTAQGLAWPALAWWMWWRTSATASERERRAAERTSHSAGGMTRNGLNRGLTIVVCIAASGPVLLEWLTRRFGVGEAPEIVWLVALQSVALAASTDSRRSSSSRVAGLLSGFTTLFSLAIATRPAVYVAGGLFTMLLLWWLMARYWERVQTAHDASHVESCPPLRRSAFIAALGIATVAVVAAAAVGTSLSTTHALSGFMPASGGRDDSSEFARSGVGDGDMLVSARDEALSFGPVDSDLFLESELPSLYDMFNETYGDPPKPKRHAERTIALAAENLRELEQRIARSEGGGREFSALRQRSTLPQSPLRDRPSAAILQVVGEVPVHLALERFAHFDGRTWRPLELRGRRPAPRVESIDGKPRYVAQRFLSSPLHRAESDWGVKIVNLKTNRIPVPPGVTSVHIDRSQEEGFVDWSADGGFEIPGQEFLPQLTVLHVRAAAFELTPLRSADFSAALPRPSESSSSTMSPDIASSPGDWLAAHRDVTPELRRHQAIAEEWTRDVPRGWRQVERIVDRLRRDFRHDPDSLAPESCDDVVAHFLEAKAGPDYLFATAAATLLRSLGYPARLVSGFYARAERYDRRHRQTAVLASDVHTWVEVAVDERTWVAIEPTPGYSPPRESRTWSAWALDVWWTIGQFVRQYSLTLGVLALACVAAWRYRVPLLDAVLTLTHRALGRGTRERRLCATLRLLEWRSWLIGAPRPDSTTVTGWYGRCRAESDGELARHLSIFLRSVERALYGPGESSRNGAPTDSVLRASDYVARTLSARRLRQFLLVRESAS